MRSHFAIGRGVAAACIAAGAASLPAAAQTAFDNPGQPAYDDGWQAGDNGGFGFGPWSMFGTYSTPIQHSLDTTSPFDSVRVAPLNGGAPRAWRLFNPNLPEPQLDISQAGRALPTPLQVGQTISVLIDNPTERRFFRGYTVRLNTGGNNTVYQGNAQSRLAVGTFEYFTNGQWYATGGNQSPSLFDTDTTVAGMLIEVTLNTVNTYTLRMDPLGPAPAFITSGTLSGPAGAPIDWIEFEMYNTTSNPGIATDFYIGGMQITPAPGSLALLAAAGGLSIFRRRRAAPRA
jgi:hypothetical protein